MIVPRIESVDGMPIKRRSEGRSVVTPTIAALNRMRGVRVARNLSALVVPAEKRDDHAVRPMWCGLGLGSADIVGIVKLDPRDKFGIPFALECKLPKEGKLRAGAMKPDQLLWLPAFRRAGGFACVVHGIDEAMAAVARCRAGESE